MYTSFFFKLSFCFRYDPDSNQWVSLCPMNSRRLGVGLAVCGGCLYAIGGSDGSAPLATVERCVMIIVSIIYLPIWVKTLS